MSANYNILICM